jgi:hypothetical protein
LRKPLTKKDLENAIDGVFKEAKEDVWTFEPISKETLLDHRMTFDRSGLLVEGEYEDTGFPSFYDEAHLAPVSVEEYSDSREIEMGEAGDEEEHVEEEGLTALEGEAAAGEGETLKEMGEDKDEEEALAPLTPHKQRKRARSDPTFSGSGIKAAVKAGESGSPEKKRKIEDLEEDKGCDCGVRVTEDWKLEVDEWTRHTFEEQHGLLSEIYDVVRSEWSEFDSEMEPCLQHYELLCENLDCHYKDDKKQMTTMFAKIYEVTKGKGTFHAAWVHPETRDFFVPTERIAKYQQRKTLRSRYQPEPIQPIPETLSFPTPIKFSFKDNHLVEVDPTIFGWADNHGILDLIALEVQMLEWHSRRSTKEREYLTNSYFSLAAQLMWADPLMWLKMRAQHKDKPIWMMAYPLPLRFFPAGSSRRESFCMRDPDKTGDEASLCAELLLDGPGMERFYFSTKNPREADALFTKAAGGSSYISTTYSPQEMYAFGTAQGKIPTKRSWISEYAMEKSEVHFWQAGTGIRYSFKDIARDYFSLPLAYVKVGADGVCENGIDYKMLSRGVWLGATYLATFSVFLVFL